MSRGGARRTGRGGRRGKERDKRWKLVLGALLVGALVWGGTRIDVDETIRELTLPLRYPDTLREEARDVDVARTLHEGEFTLPTTDPALIAAVIYAESRFRDQTSSAGARGLMQITHDTADTIESLSGGETFEYEDLSDPELNIRYGSYFFRYLLYRFEGNEIAALAGYNAGEENARAWGGSDLGLTDIRFPETRAYVAEVLEKRDQYRESYATELGL